MSDGETAAEKLQSSMQESSAREAGERFELSKKAYRKYHGRPMVGTETDYWREAFFLADEVRCFTSPAPKPGLEVQAEKVLSHSQKLERAHWVDQIGVNVSGARVLLDGTVKSDTALSEALKKLDRIEELRLRIVALATVEVAR